VIEMLDPLARTPGVRWVGLVTQDGVPIAVPGCARESGEAGSDELEPEAVAALATAWMDDSTRSLATLSWDAPRRVVLRAARGTLVMLATRGAVLLAVLDSGVGPEELRLPMDGVVARIQRTLRGMGRETAPAASAPPAERTPPALPGGAPVRPNPAAESRAMTHDEPQQGGR
jgi:predicted regulator of Ras-like GTPase activity (Roadblock/LC7/MglB family)